MMIINTGNTQRISVAVIFAINPV